jgi:hypothetical protein
VNVPQASHIQPIQPSSIELMRKIPLHPFPSAGLQTLASCSGNPPSIRIHCRLLRRFAFPFPCATFRLGNIAAEAPLGQFPHYFITVYPLSATTSSIPAWFTVRSTACSATAIPPCRGLDELSRQ